MRKVKNEKVSGKEDKERERRESMKSEDRKRRIKDKGGDRG